MSNSTYTIPVSVCRKISTPENENQGVVIYVGQSPINSFAEIPDEENVRRYTLEAGSRKRRSGVHEAIFNTLENAPQKFSILNGGICIVAKKAIPSKDQKFIELIEPSIINGSQTRGVIRDFLSESASVEFPNIKFEIIVTDDADLMTEASIARNNQIAVKQISILGARDVFNELDGRIKSVTGGKELRKSETDRGENYIQTEKLLQVIAALIPECLWSATGKNSFSKVFTYSGQAGPLKLFEKIYNEAKGLVEVSEEQKNAATELYAFYLDIAPYAYNLYEKWHSGKPFEGQNWKKADAVVRKKDTREIIYAHDGVIFPIIAAYSVFTEKTKDGWELNIPDICDDAKVVHYAHQAFKNSDYNPNVMGKTEASYSQISTLTETIYTLLSTHAA